MTTAAARELPQERGRMSIRMPLLGRDKLAFRVRVRLYDAPAGPVAVLEEKANSLPLRWVSEHLALQLLASMQNEHLQVFERITHGESTSWAHIAWVHHSEGGMDALRNENPAESVQQLRDVLEGSVNVPARRQQPAGTGQYL